MRLALLVRSDGINLLPWLTGQVKESPRESFFYFSDDGDIMSIRIGDVKLTFAVQESLSSNVWADPLKKLRVPHIYHLRRDPFERADFNSQVYWKWLFQHAPYLYLCQAVVAAQVDEFVKYPPRQKAASFNLDTVMASLVPAEAAYKKQQAEAAAAASAAKAAPAKAKDSQRELAPAD